MRSFIFLFFVLFCLNPSFLWPESNTLKIFFTSNLEGKFVIESKDEDDPLLNLSSLLLTEQNRNPGSLLIDLGNSFYPGALSKYSYGSVMMDFFHYTGYKSILVSSMDIRIGFENLAFLQKDKKTLLLSSNLLKNQKPIFNPYFEVNAGKKEKIVFIGVSSQKLILNISEKKLRKINIHKIEEAVDSVLSLYEDREHTHFVLLSGLTHEENLMVLKKYPAISAIIGGGDNNGNFSGLNAEQMLLSDGRAIYYLSRKNGYYEADLEVGALFKIKSFYFKPAKKEQMSDDENFFQLKKRVAIWKDQFTKDNSKKIANLNQNEYILDDEKMSLLMRSYFHTEISLIKIGSVRDSRLSGEINEADLFKLFFTDFPLLKFNLSGRQIKAIYNAQNDFIMNGYDAQKEKIHGYFIDGGQNYTVVSSQSGYEMACEMNEAKIPYRNTWRSFLDLLKWDLARVKSFPDFDVAAENDSHFFSHIQFNFSLFYDQSSIKKGGDISTPAGQPDISYSQLGIESSLTWVLYNRWHQITFNPYLNFEKKTQKDQPDEFINNLFRGTLVYRLNCDFFLKPYQKSQLDTVVKKVDGERPTLIRETVGSSIGSDIIEGNLGFGFEKKVHAPVLDPQYGMEVLLKLKWSILDNLVFKSSIDFFWSQDENNKSLSSFKTQAQTGFYFNFTDDFGISIRYNWFYYYSGEYKQSYSYSQIFTAVDLKTDFKVF